MVLITVPRLRSVDSRIDVDAADDHLAREMIAQQFVQARAAHDVREQDGNFRLGAAQAMNPSEPAAAAACGSRRRNHYT